MLAEYFRVQDQGCQTQFLRATALWSLAPTRIKHS